MESVESENKELRHSVEMKMKKTKKSTSFVSQLYNKKRLTLNVRHKGVGPDLETVLLRNKGQKKRSKTCFNTAVTECKESRRHGVRAGKFESSVLAKHSTFVERKWLKCQHH